MVFSLSLGFPGGSVVKNCLPMQDTQEARVRSLDQKDPLEEEMTIHSSILAWENADEPGGLQSMELRRVRHN